MLANEIRNGVYLKWKDNGQIFDVSIGLMLDKYFWKHIEAGDIIPIPITPDILNKIDWDGYVKLHINSYFSLDDVGHLYYSNDYTGININYLHQLQNLYFSLTNKELNIEL